MKKGIEFLMSLVMVAMMAAVCVTMTSCGGDDDDAGTGDSQISSKLKGTWEARYFYFDDDINTQHPVYYEPDEYGHVPTTVTLNSDGTFTANGMLPNGSGTWRVTKKNYKTDDCYGVIDFYQNGALKKSAKITSFMNDYKSGEVRITGYIGRIWFEKK